MAELNTDVRYIKGIGEKKAQAFKKLGVSTVYDLISFFPRRYEDRSLFVPISETADGEACSIKAIVADSPKLVRIKRGMELVKFTVVDDSGAANITFFNQSYLKNSFIKGECYRFYGKVEAAGNRRSMANPVYERDDGTGTGVGVTGRIMPIYRMCAGLNQKSIVDAVTQGLRLCGEQLPEVLPEVVRDRCRLVQSRYAYENIHAPADFVTLELARRRFIFEELFVLSCALSMMRGERTEKTGNVISADGIEDFYSILPFSPTNAQKKAISEALADMSSGKVMNRLVQGDVGSGKTLVAAALIVQTFKSGFMSAFMAPTEILARQHFENLSSLLTPLGLRIAMLTGGMSAKEKRETKKLLREGECDLVIGTHALFSEDVEYTKLGLVVTDEQHRFGVRQRSALITKSNDPHVLVMSATPIPRTLALMIYGDLDVSIINELPPGRQKIDTFSVDESYRRRLNGFIRKLVTEGRQVYVVCPMVDENDGLPMKLLSASEHAETLSVEFPDLKVGCVHGRMKPKEKDAVMGDFVSGKTDILVATTVIEVGVDVPNAALMIIENAERFGLSQLHQLRGRVGRGEHKSYCILVSDSKSDDVRARLKIMTKTNDGFKISEEDLRLRGPGDFFGSRQHGLPEMHVADLGADMDVMQQAQEESKLILEADPELERPENAGLKRQVERLFALGADSFN